MMENKHPDLSIVVPVYNGSLTIELLFERTKASLQKLNKTFEFIFVDDYSKDNSWEKIHRLKLTYPELVTGIRLSRNFGQHNATLCGIKYASGDWIITIDDDLEYEPENIESLLQEQQQSNTDLVYGVIQNQKRSFLRRQFSKYYKKTARFFEGNEKCAGSSFRLMRNNLAKDILTHARNFSFIDEFVLWHTANITSIQILPAPELHRKSRYSFWNLGLMTKELVFFSSIAPLRFVTLLGGFMVGANFLAGLIIIYRRLVLTIDQKGYTSIIVTVLFSSGLIILCLGIIAEYISKLLKVSYDKPSYIESEKI